MSTLDEKISAAMSTDFVGDIIFTDEELATIYGMTRNLLWQIDDGLRTSIPPQYQSMVFVAMVNAVKEYGSDDSDETFWNVIFKKLFGEESQKIYLCLTGVIKDLYARDKIYHLAEMGKKYYATLSAHAFTPVYAMNSFFDLCWDIYCKDLQFMYDENDDIFLLIADAIAQKINASGLKEDAGVFIGSKVYDFKVGLKGLALYDKNGLVKLIKRAVKNFDSVHNRDAEIDVENSYFNKLFADWWENKQFNFGTEKAKKIRASVVSDYKKINAKYYVENNEVLIGIPPIRLQDNYDILPTICLYDGNTLVESEKMDTIGTGLLMATKQYDIVIKNHMNTANIRVVISHNGEVIYDSKDKLYREAILLSMDKGNEVTGNIAEPNTYYYVYTNDTSIIDKFDVDPVSNTLFTIYPVEGNIIQINNGIVTFTEREETQKILVTGKNKHSLKFIKDEIVYKVFDGDVLLVVSNDISALSVGIKINDAVFKLSDFNSENKGDFSYYNMTECLDVCEPSEIVVFEYATDKIIYSEQAVKFNQIEINFDRKFYYDQNDDGHLEFTTAKYHKEIDFGYEKDYVELPFDEGGVLLVQIPLIKWQIDKERAYNNKLAKAFWYKDISDGAILRLTVPKGIDVLLFDNDRHEIAYSPKNRGYEIGRKVYSMAADINNKHDQFVVYLRTGKEVMLLCSFALKEMFAKAPIRYIDNSIIFNPINSFIGDNDTKFNIVLSKYEEQKAQYKVDYVPSRLILSEDLKHGYYDVDIYVDRGLLISQKVKVYHDIVGIGSIDELKFVGKKIKLSKAHVLHPRNVVDLKDYYIDNISYITEEGGFNFYKGFIYKLDKEHHKYITRLPIGNDEWETINPVRIEIMDSGNCWLTFGYGGDGWNDISGEFALENGITLTNKFDHVREIDYYEYEVKE